MVRHKQYREEQEAPPFALRATWSVGVRTTAWDHLWRMILSDLGPEAVAVGVDHFPKEAGDGRSIDADSTSPVTGG